MSKILIVDDLELSRQLIIEALNTLGHEVYAACNGVEALEILENKYVSIVISDWVMPIMDGVELCRKIRAADLGRYIYFILLTAKDSKNELVQGMRGGADDFLVKPFNSDELDVRIRAGERIVMLENDLVKRNNILHETNEKLNQAYITIKNDLETAAKIQASLLPSMTAKTSLFNSSWMFIPSDFVAGDIFNYLWLDENNIAFFILDVSGHGVPAAMLSVTVSKILTMPVNEGGLLSSSKTISPGQNIISPSEVVKGLNARFQSEGDEMQYFTIVYGVMNVKSGSIQLTQAGHPHPIYLPKDGEAALIGNGGYPVGMLPDVEYEVLELRLGKGDRLFLYSDGVTECFNKNMEQFSQERLVKTLEEGKDTSLGEVVDGVEQKLRLWKSAEKFEDDITLLAFEML